MNTSDTLVTKLDGAVEPFAPEKLISSLRRSGANEDYIKDIVRQVEAELYDKIPTSEIYQRAFSLLRKYERPTAARYSMKRAVRELGPSGFPFEDFVSELYRHNGYTVATGTMVRGKCAEHELDLRAEKDGNVIGAELKFHNNLGIKSDLKVALYVQARFEDLRAAGAHDGITEGWLITNTSFTQNALDYGACVGLNMISWSYPDGGTLQDLIENAGVQPITSLTSLTQKEKKLLLEERVVLCKALPDSASVMKSIGMSDRRIEAALAESQAVCGVAS